MKRNNRRLSLDREIIKYLDRAELAPVNGGVTSTCTRSEVQRCVSKELSFCVLCIPE